MIPSSWHGVTTVVVGNCGVGFAPVRPADHERLIELMEGVEDIPGAVLARGPAWNWQSFPEFLDALDGRPVRRRRRAAGAARRAAPARDGRARRRPRARDRRRHRADGDARRRRRSRPARSASRRRARSTTARAAASPRRRSPPRPTSWSASPRRSARPARACCRWSPTSPTSTPSSRIFRRMAEASGRPLSFSLAQTPRRQLAPPARAARRGQRRRACAMTGQVAPRPVGLLLGLQCTLHPFLANPVYREIAALPLRRAGRRDPRSRRSSDRVLDGDAAEARTRAALLQAFDRMFELGDPPDYEPDPAIEHRRAGPSARAATRSTSPTTCCSPTTAGRSSTCRSSTTTTATSTRPARCSPTRTPSSASATAAPTSARSATPASRPRCSRSGAATATTAGSTLPFLVQRQTQATARTVGLLDRGVLAPGYRADVNVIDFDRLTRPPARDALRPARRRQAPRAARRRLRRHDRRRPGHLRARRGDRTRCPGRLVRGPQPAPATGASR